MKHFWSILGILLVVAGVASAQMGQYEAQIQVVEELIQEKNFASAIAQANALVESGEQAQLPQLEGRARFLLGRSLTENRKATAKERVKGIRELRHAARLLRGTNALVAVDSIANILEKLTGSKDMEEVSLPSLQASQKRSPNQASVGAEELNEAALNAIVALQDKEITALADSQLRQILLLERQDRQLDEYAFQQLNDSLLLLQQDRQLVNERAAVARERQNRNVLFFLAAGVAILLGLVYSRYRSSMRFRTRLEAQNAVIKEERLRSEELLLNILPVTVAAELKETGKATARSFASVSVLFVDFKGFSSLAATLAPEQLIALLDEAFSAFDEIVVAHRLEKIKTIGDAYMCAGGLPIEDKDHAERTVRAAMAMQDYLSGNEHFAARMGIHTGPVVAGVVGKHKFVYDIWGDTVNQASRLEVAGEPGRIAISRATCEQLGEAFHCEPAGSFQAKNIGSMERFFVTLK